jgi:hypothetical protein
MKTKHQPLENEEPFVVILLELIAEIRDALVPHHNDDAQFYDNADLKKFLHVSDSTLYRMRKNNLLRYKKIGGKIFYPKADFNKAFKI